jgi:hypothetical protein
MAKKPRAAKKCGAKSRTKPAKLDRLPTPEEFLKASRKARSCAEKICCAHGSARIAAMTQRAKVRAADGDTFYQTQGRQILRVVTVDVKDAVNDAWEFLRNDHRTVLKALAVYHPEWPQHIDGEAKDSAHWPLVNFIESYYLRVSGTCDPSNHDEILEACVRHDFQNCSAPALDIETIEKKLPSIMVDLTDRTNQRWSDTVAAFVGGMTAEADRIAGELAPKPVDLRDYMPASKCAAQLGVTLAKLKVLAKKEGWRTYSEPRRLWVHAGDFQSRQELSEEQKDAILDDISSRKAEIEAKRMARY